MVVNVVKKINYEEIEINWNTPPEGVIFQVTEKQFWNELTEFEIQYTAHMQWCNGLERFPNRNDRTVIQGVVFCNQKDCVLVADVRVGKPTLYWKITYCNHNWQETTPTEPWSCWHTYECQNCHDRYSVDSSD